MPTIPHTVASLRGGLNEAAPISLRDDQCVIALNVEWVESPLGERRLGALQINLAGSPLATCSRIGWLHRHLPTTDLHDAQLWGWGVIDSPAGVVLAYKDTTWHTVALPDAAVLNGKSEYEVSGQTLHGKLFIAYHSVVNRLHVWDGTTFRRAGIAPSAGAVSVATFGAGTFGGTRYYRVRFSQQVAGVTKLRNEPTLSTQFVPPGTGEGALMTRPAPPGDGETHTEWEASTDNVNFYRIATTPVATTTQTDAVPFATGYLVAGFPLVEDVGDYTVIPAVRYLAADEDRLMGAGSFVDASINSRVMWTPVFNSVGVGNDERISLRTNPSVDLDNYEGGDLTGLSSDVNGYLYATKFHHIYQLARTGVRTRAYEAIPLTKQRGALKGSLVEGFNQAGSPFLFALDPDIGPVHIGGPNGIEPCGADLIETWKTVNLDAAVISRGVYFPEKRQVHWWIATGGFNSPSAHLVLHCNLMRPDAEGARGGFAVWDGLSAGALAVCMFADNIDDGGPRSRFLKPFIGVQGNGLIWRTDTGDDDNGTAYFARIKTKPFARSGLLDDFEVGEGELMARAATAARVDLIANGMRSDLSQVAKTIAGIDFTAGAGEGARIIRSLDNLSLAELQTIQIEIRDEPDAPGPQWFLELLSMTLTGGQKARQ